LALSGLHHCEELNEYARSSPANVMANYGEIGKSGKFSSKTAGMGLAQRRSVDLNPSSFQVLLFLGVAPWHLRSATGGSLWTASRKDHDARGKPVAKLLLYRARRLELEGSANPFAAIVLAHLTEMETRQTRQPGTRSSCGC
jgi:hypothetical protein